MSGIAGIIRFDGAPVEPGLIEKMTSAMAYRGPDGINHWVKGPVALGQCMLRTTPESLAESQPLVSEDGCLVLVMDGRLDNREELRRELEKQRIKIRTDTDPELVLGAYQLWGEANPKHLLGDFAYAVWDVRRHKLFCAVDHMGARPFYYAINKRFFAFASEEEALLALPGMSSHPNEEQIAGLLVPAFQSFDNSRSWLRDVWGLMPAQSLTILSNGTSRTEYYWRLEPGEESYCVSDQECEEAFLGVFGEAVRCRMRTTGNIAAMMSGGLDSAGIAAMVKRLLPEMSGKEFHTYSAISDYPESCVESLCIQSLTKDFGAKAHYVSVPSFQGMVSVKDIIGTLWSKAHPADNSITIPAMMCLAASREGDRVMLTGVSGDYTMHVPDRYAAYLLKTGQWRPAWDECQGASRNHTYLYGASPIILLLLNAWTVYMPNKIKVLAHRLRNRGRNVINPDFSRKLQLADRLRMQNAKKTWFWDGNISNDHAALISSIYGIVLGLTGYDRVAGRYGVELRDPWADKRVVEFFLRLPLKYKVRDGWTKYLARTAFAPDLDYKVRRRLGKEHLGPIVTNRLMEESDALVSYTMEHSLGTLSDYVDMNAVCARYEKYKRSNTLLDREFVYEIITLILWLRRISS